MSRPAPTFTDAQLRRMRVAVERSDATLVEIARRYRTSEGTIVRIADRNGWQMGRRRVRNRKAADVRAAPAPG